MREIKFRAWDIEDNVMIQNIFSHFAGPSDILQEPYYIPMQYTGLKDKNGKEIYEGDVLRSDIYPFSCTEDNKYDNYYGAIGWSEEEASFYIVAIKNPKSSVRGISDGICDSISQKMMQDFEVLGNIHDPEWKQYGEYIQEEDKEESDD